MPLQVLCKLWNCAVVTKWDEAIAKSSLGFSGLYSFSSGALHLLLCPPAWGAVQERPHCARMPSWGPNRDRASPTHFSLSNELWCPLCHMGVFGPPICTRGPSCTRPTCFCSCTSSWRSTSSSATPPWGAAARRPRRPSERVQNSDRGRSIATKGGGFWRGNFNGFFPSDEKDWDCFVR